MLRIGQPIEALAWLAARLVARWPKTTVALAVAVTAATPVTLREVTGVVVGDCAILGLGYLAGYRERRFAIILAEIAKFRKRADAVRRRWVTVTADGGLAKPAVAGGPDKRRPKILRITPDPLGVAVLVNGSPVSAGPDAFVAAADKLQHGLRCRSVKIEPAGHNVLLRLRYEDAFTRAIRFADLPAPTRRNHVVVGLDEDGAPVEKALWLPTLLVGSQGSGKSTETMTILRGLLAARIPFRLRVFDPKGGQEFSELDGAAWEYERDPNNWTQFLGHAIRALGARQAALRAQGLKKVDTYTVDCPLDVMVIDELLTAMAFGGKSTVKVGNKSMSAEDAFMTFLSTARAAGFTVIASTQLPQKEVLGKIRDLFGHLTLLRVAPTGREIVDIILGAGASKVYPAHQLPADERSAGVGFTGTPRGVVKYRAAFLDQRERDQVGAAIGRMTERLRRTATEDGGQP